MTEGTKNTAKRWAVKAAREALRAARDEFIAEARAHFTGLKPAERRKHPFIWILWLRRRRRNPNGEVDYFGGCPLCADGKNDGFMNVGRAHWFVCHIHGLKWCAGENLFSCWRDQSKEHWQENAELLASYSEVEPLYSE